jgi:hypothetical protein
MDSAGLSNPCAAFPSLVEKASGHSISPIIAFPIKNKLDESRKSDPYIYLNRSPVKFLLLFDAPFCNISPMFFKEALR